MAILVLSCALLSFGRSILVYHSADLYWVGDNAVGFAQGWTAAESALETSLLQAWIDSQIGIFLLEREKIGLAVANELESASKSELYRDHNGYIDALLAPLRGYLGQPTT